MMAAAHDLKDSPAERELLKRSCGIQLSRNAREKLSNTGRMM